MKLEAGKIYRAKNGQIFGPMDFRVNGYFYAAEFKWLSNGEYSGADRGFDLITEVTVTDVKRRQWVIEIKEHYAGVTSHISQTTEADGTCHGSTALGYGPTIARIRVTEGEGL